MTDPTPLIPQPNPPDHANERRITLTIGGRRGSRFELIHRLEVRKVARVPGELVEMPAAKEPA